MTIKIIDNAFDSAVIYLDQNGNQQEKPIDSNDYEKIKALLENMYINRGSSSFLIIDSGHSEIELRLYVEVSGFEEKDHGIPFSIIENGELDIISSDIWNECIEAIKIYHPNYPN